MYRSVGLSCHGSKPPIPGLCLSAGLPVPLSVVPLTVSGYRNRKNRESGSHNLFLPITGLTLTDASQDHYKKQKLASQTTSTDRNATR